MCVIYKLYCSYHTHNMNNVLELEIFHVSSFPPAHTAHKPPNSEKNAEENKREQKFIMSY